jgi:hypothetical protein
VDEYRSDRGGLAMSRLPDSVFERLSPLGQSMVRIEERVSRFVPGDGTGKRQCVSCIRKRYGGPSCCDEGWERYRKRHRGGDPGGCVNWVGWDKGLAGPEVVEAEATAEGSRDDDPAPDVGILVGMSMAAATCIRRAATFKLDERRLEAEACAFVIRRAGQRLQKKWKMEVLWPLLESEKGAQPEAEVKPEGMP